MTNRCVCCGEEIPEGRTVCWRCEHGHPIKQQSPPSQLRVGKRAGLRMLICKLQLLPKRLLKKLGAVHAALICQIGHPSGE